MCRRWLLLRWRREKICNNTTTKKRTQKRRETRPRKSKLSVLEPPLSVLSQLFSFIQSACGEERYKNARFVSLKQKESKRWRKELPPFHPLSSTSIDDSNACDFLARVRARTQKKSDIICARKCAQRRARESEEEMKKKWMRFLDTDTKVVSSFLFSSLFVCCVLKCWWIFRCMWKKK